MRWVRYHEVESQVQNRNWVAFLSPYAYVPFLLNIFLITAKFVSLFIKYDSATLRELKGDETKYLHVHLFSSIIYLYVLINCIKSKRSIPNEARSYVMIPYQQSIHVCCIVMAATSSLLSVFLCTNLIPHSVVMEEGILGDLLFVMYSGSILIGFLASHSFYLRDSAIAPFDLILRIVVAFIISVLPAVKVALGSDLFTSYQLQFVSAVFSMALYSDFSIRMYQCAIVHRYVKHRLNLPVALSLIGLQTDHSLITSDRYAPAHIVSPLTYNMNLGDNQADVDRSCFLNIHSDFIVREAAASLNNLAIFHQSKVALYSCLSW